jgi:hypothetical protein
MGNEVTLPFKTAIIAIETKPYGEKTVIGFSLTEEQRMLQATARDFAQHVLKPAVAEVLRLKRANIPHRPWDVCKYAVKKGTELGFNKLLPGLMIRACFIFPDAEAMYRTTYPMTRPTGATNAYRCMTTS